MSQSECPTIENCNSYIFSTKALSSETKGENVSNLDVLTVTLRQDLNKDPVLCIQRRLLSTWGSCLDVVIRKLR